MLEKIVLRLIYLFCVYYLLGFMLLVYLMFFKNTIETCNTFLLPLKLDLNKTYFFKDVLHDAEHIIL
jgi:hypothetical protein